MRMDVLLLIDRLDDMVRGGTPVRRGAHVRIERKEAFELLDEMRAQIPEEIGQARFIRNEREAMLQEAKIEAERIVSEAREERSRIIGSAELGRLAEQRAEKILEGARARARQIRLGAEGYADEILEGLESGLGQLAAARSAKR
jgi:hypothetical protein